MSLHIHSSTPITGVQISSQTRYPDIQKSGYRSVSGYQGSPVVKCPEIKAYIGTIRFPDITKSGYRSSPDIESSSYQNMPFDP